MQRPKIDSLKWLACTQTVSDSIDTIHTQAGTHKERCLRSGDSLTQHFFRGTGSEPRLDGLKSVCRGQRTQSCDWLCLPAQPSPSLLSDYFFSVWELNPFHFGFRSIIALLALTAMHKINKWVFTFRLGSCEGCDILTSFKSQAGARFVSHSRIFI